jgi:SWI/SNF-related matrix-associated actin-dependent regulator 1 of chromatin subfamily A
MSGVLIADEMGLGKTVQALAVLAATDAFPAVIVCPASLKLNWRREVQTWLPGKSTHVLYGTRPVPPGRWPDVTIVNYDILKYWSEHLPAVGALILDESHYIKNGNTLRAKAAVRYSDRLAADAVRICLSGTPVVNAPGELVTQLRVLQRLDDFGGLRAFKERYGRGQNLPELNRRLRATCYVRRRKADVLTELPPKRWSNVLVEGDPTVLAEYRQAEADIVSYLAGQARDAAKSSGASSEQAQRAAWQSAMRARAAEHLVAIGALKRLAAKAKMAAARSWIENFCASGSKLVAFAHHTSVVDVLADEFAGGCAVRGGDSAEARQAAVDRFQNDADQRVIACSLKAAGVGLTLTAASDVVFLEQGWTPADMDQASDRCHRIGQTDSVTAWNLLCADTIDEDIAALIADKRLMVNAATDGSPSGENGSVSVLGDLLVRLADRGLALTG